MSQLSASPHLLDSIYTALGHAKRREILFTLATHPATVKQLADEQHLSLPAIHKHIRAMEAAELIQRKKVGRTNFVAINRVGIRAAQTWLAQYQADWGSDKETLENYIENLTKSV